jgi:hypothetical protein
MRRNAFCALVMVCVTCALAAVPSGPSQASSAVYYVSSSAGNDGRDGLSIGNAFRTVGRVNSLNLQPGDKVLFKCGDTWQAEQTVANVAVTVYDPSPAPAGTETLPLVFRVVPSVSRAYLPLVSK